MPQGARPEFINRELSWLDFNFRVLAEAERTDLPLLERVKFLAIVSSNLDEFFMVRVALMHRAVEQGCGPSGPDGLSPRQTLAKISERAHHMQKRQYACFDKEVRPRLKQEGIDLVRLPDLTAEDRSFLWQYFDEQLQATLTPMAVDTGHPFPLLANLANYILFKVTPRQDVSGSFLSEADTVLVQIPTGLDRFLPLPSTEDAPRFAVLDDVVMLFAEELLGGYQIQGAHPFRVTRDAEFTVDDEQAANLMVAIEEELRTRRRGEPVRLELAEGVPGEIRDYLQKQLDLEERDIYAIPSLLDLKSLFGLLGEIDRPKLLDPSWPPQPHPAFLEEVDIFTVIRQRDVILHHPYQSFDPVVDFIRRAADDEDVLAIKITLYRVSGDSPLIEALIQAAEMGKQVTVLVELRARFDEEANIQWARRLDTAGAHVIYGVVGYKTHSKVALVVRREPGGICRYVHLSTGNYNDRTARVYTDLGYFTARPEFGADISAFFNVITGYSLPPKWNRIEMSPTGMRDRMMMMIDREIEKHTPETPGFIRAKMNSLIDPAVIRALYRASSAGVKIDLVVRGMCRLRAGVTKLSENIRVRSVVDRFLEHPRIYHFHNGGNEEVYLSSADWMERNFDNRLELLFPILEPGNRRTVLQVIDLALADNINAWELQPDDTYKRIRRRGRQKLQRSQEILYQMAVELAGKTKHGSGKYTFVAKTSPE